MEIPKTAIKFDGNQRNIFPIYDFTDLNLANVPCWLEVSELSRDVVTRLQRIDGKLTLADALTLPERLMILAKLWDLFLDLKLLFLIFDYICQMATSDFITLSTFLRGTPDL